MKHLIVCAVLVMISGSILKADYYVDCSTGSDSNPGTQALPFATLQKAKSAMEGSDTKQTQVQSCTYSIAGGSWNFTSSDNGETWIPFLGATVIIDGGGTGYLNLSGVSDFTFEGFTLQNMPGGRGRTGDILMDTLPTNITLRWLTFLNCLGYCIQARNLQSSLIDSNTFSGQSPGVNPANNHPYKVVALSSGSSNNTVSHNLIKNAQGGGIDFDRGPADPVQSNNTMDRNILVNTNTSDCDMGALYAYDPDARSSGLTITNNNVFGVGPTSTVTCSGPKNWHSIYLDDGVSGATVTGNLCNRCGGGLVSSGGPGVAVIHGGNNNTVRNNIFDLSDFNYPGGDVRLGLYQDSASTDMADNTFRNNIIYSAATFSTQFWNEYGPVQTPLTDKTNDYWSANGSTISPDCPGCDPPLGCGSTSALTCDDSNTNCDPGFANPAGNDYTITNPSCTNQISWQTRPTDQGPLANPFNP